MKVIKKIIIPLSLSASLVLASVPQNIGYQGVAYKDGLAVTTPISAKFTILGSDNSVVYQETKKDISTSSKGFFTHSIGEGTPLDPNTTFDKIIWNDGYKLKIEADFTNGTTYTELGIQDFYSVPYSLNSSNSDNSITAKRLEKQVAISLDGDANGTILFDGSSNQTLSVTIADDSHNHTNILGNSQTATKLKTARTLSLTGDASGSTTFDGSANKSISVVVNNNSHTHTSANISDASSAHGGNTIVKRDGSGNVTLNNIYTVGNIYLDNGNYIYNRDYTTDYFGWTGNDSYKLLINNQSRIYTYSGGIVFNEDSNNIDFRVESNNNSNMLFVDAGNDRVGIGVTPRFPLHVKTQTAYNLSSSYDYYKYFNKSSSIYLSGTSDGVHDASIYAEGAIMTTDRFKAISDKRVKKDITPIISSIKTIEKLNPVHYKKIDSFEYGDKLNYGFIAQELEKVIPEAVTIGTGNIPILKPFDKVDFEDNIVYTLLVNNGDEIKEQKYTTKDDKPEGDIIVKSKEVNDFRSVTYDYVFTIAVDAIQEQQDIIEKQQAQLDKITTALKNAGITIE